MKNASFVKLPSPSLNPSHQGREEKISISGKSNELSSVKSKSFPLDGEGKVGANRTMVITLEVAWILLLK